jgi:hypothetical protein
VRRRAGTHSQLKQNGPRISSAPHRNSGVLRFIRGTLMMRF